MQSDADPDEAPCEPREERRRPRWQRILGLIFAAVLFSWLLYRTTIYLTVAQLHGRGVINDDATTRWRIRLSAKQLILGHKRAVVASRGLSDRELIATEGLDKFNDRIAAWNALTFGATISNDATMEDYIRQHLQSNQRWTSEGSFDDPHQPENDTNN